MPGKFTFEYSVITYPSSKPMSEVYAQAAAFNANLRALVEPLHSGALPASAALVQAEPAEFAISAIKLCEDGSGWIVRGYNLGASALQARLVPWRPFTHAEKVSLSEQVIALLEVAHDGSVTFPVRGCEIVTIKFY
jgi:alpha-mannosidase